MLSQQAHLQPHTPCDQRRGFSALTQQRCAPHKPARQRVAVQAGKEEKEQPGIGLKAAWTAAEQFGNLSALVGGQRAGRKSAEQKKHISRDEALASIRADYERNYFVSGDGDLAAYDPDCLFKDDFASFNGVDRFLNNVSNLGGLTEDVKLDVVGWDEREDSLKAKWRFSSILKLPWRPRLAAAGATTYVFDKVTGLVVEHIEEWDVEAQKVIQQLFKPAKKPETDIERFMDSLSRGAGWAHQCRVLSAWTIISNYAILPSGGVIAALAAARRLGGENSYQGVLFDGIALTAWAVFAAAFVSEFIKVAQGQDSRPQ